MMRAFLLSLALLVPGLAAAQVPTLSGSDPNNAPFTDWPTLVPTGGIYTVPPGTRKLIANVTGSGTIVLTSANGNTVAVPLGLNLTELSVTPVSFTTTATGVFTAWR